MTKMRGVLSRVFALGLAVGCAATGCRGKEHVTGDIPGTVLVRQETEGLLLTWIDEKGDFHVEQKVSDVPLIGRDAVRVVDPSREEGTHSDKVFVADMRVAQASGNFPVRTMTRLEFDQLAVLRRQKQGVATMPSAAPSAEVPFAVQQPQQPNAPNAPEPGAVARPQVVIYGASWCSACHDAAAYLRQRGVAYVEKDIEVDADAAREMRSKLAKNGLRSGSIPVLDVRGKVMVGFNSHSVDEALGKAL